MNGIEILKFIKESKMTSMEKAIAEEYIYRNEKLKEDGKSNLELDYEKIKKLTNRFIKNEKIWEEINFTLDNELEELDIEIEEEI